MVLDPILAVKKEEIATLRSKGMPAPTNTNPVSFKGAIQRNQSSTPRPSIRVIAECKKASPSSGLLRAEYDPSKIAREYAELGANAISCLTDFQFFQGDKAHVAQAKTSGLAVLRKDFIISELQIQEAKLIGADAILLIVRILSKSQLGEFIDVARHYGLDSLVEIHNEKEAEIALDVKSEIIGINHRDLDTLKMDLSLSEKIAPQIRKQSPGVIVVAESGIESKEGATRMDSFSDALLIGTAFMKTTDMKSVWANIFGEQ